VSREHLQISLLTYKTKKLLRVGYINHTNLQISHEASLRKIINIKDETMANLKISNIVTLDENEIEISAIRAQGSGGQKVNKVSAAIHLRFDVSASALPEFYKEKLLTLKDKRINKEGIVVIKSQQHRSQEQNRDEALNRLVELIKSMNVTQKRRVATKPTKGSVNRRLNSKKKQSSKKQLRGKVKSQE